MQSTPASVQEKWFARFYLAKGLVLSSLAAFWMLSGLIALTVSFHAAIAILPSHGFSRWLAQAVNLITSIADIFIGLAIGVKRTCRIGLLAGIGVSLFYTVSAVVVTPEMWLDPVGSLVKTGPAIVLMLIALAIREDR